MNFFSATFKTEAEFCPIMRFAFARPNASMYLILKPLTFYKSLIHPISNAGFEPCFVMNLECVATQNAKRRIVTGRGVFP